MTDAYDHAADIKALRLAAEQREHEQAQYLLKRLLQHLDFLIALAVPIERAQAYLPTFEHQYPQEAWARTLLLGIVSFGQAPDDSIPRLALEKDFSQPGAMNFLKALYDITQAMQSKHSGQARIGFLVSAVVNANMAELVYHWYADRQAEWERVRNNQLNAATGTSDPKAEQIALHFWLDEDVALLDEDGWMLVADSVEAKFKRQR